MQKPVLVLGSTGKTGRRVVERLKARGIPTRVGARSGEPPFDWDDRDTWAPVLQGVGSVYVQHYLDALPGVAEILGSFAELAVAKGIPRLVHLSGRGEAEAELAAQAVRDTGAEVTTLRSTWFSQNFSESYFIDGLLAGELALPAGNTPEPFVDADDIADVAVAALTKDGHMGEVYELTGPRLLTFADAVGEIAQATGREVRYLPVSIEGFAAALEEQGVPGRIDRAPRLPLPGGARRAQRPPGGRRAAGARPGAAGLRRLRAKRRRDRRLDSGARSRLAGDVGAGHARPPTDACARRPPAAALPSDWADTSAFRARPWWEVPTHSPKSGSVAARPACRAKE